MGWVPRSVHILQWNSKKAKAQKNDTRQCLGKMLLQDSRWRRRRRRRRRKDREREEEDNGMGRSEEEKRGRGCIVLSSVQDSMLFKLLVLVAGK